ncbi:hypothetical protein T492DRAFT_1070515 [Pavlovales sp. CCMP2436]|nr:hypothetical protein T492DRAFT_1070515 [Pavlovales sp. CCMP2436]
MDDDSGKKGGGKIPTRPPTFLRRAVAAWDLDAQIPATSVEIATEIFPAVCDRNGTVCQDPLQQSAHPHPTPTLRTRPHTEHALLPHSGHPPCGSDARCAGMPTASSTKNPTRCTWSRARPFSSSQATIASPSSRSPASRTPPNPSRPATYRPMTRPSSRLPPPRR